MAEDTKKRDLYYTLSGGGSGEDDIHLRDYLKVVQKHRWTVITTFVVIVTTVVIGTFSITPTYTATTIIQIERESPKVLKFEDVLPVDTSGADFYKTQERIIQSRSIAKRVIEKLSLWNHAQFKGKSLIREAEAAVPFLKGEAMEELIDSYLELLDVQLVRKSRLAEIKFNSKYPVLSADVANQVAQAYIDYNLEYKFKAAEKARDWLSGQLREFQIKVERSEEALNSFARRHGIFSLEKDENLVLKRLEGLNETLLEAESMRIAKESFIKEITKYSPHTIPAVMGDDLRFMNDLKKELSTLEAEYSNFSNQLYKKDFPKMVRLKAKMETLDNRIEEEAGNLVKRAEVAYKISLERERLLRDAFEKQKALALEMKEKAIQYNILKREVDTNKELYDGLLQRLKETGVAAGLETSNVQVVDRAMPPLKPSSPKKILNILLSMVTGLFMGTGLAFFIEYFDNTVKDPDEIRKLFDLPTLGLIPSLQSMVGKKGKRDNKRDNMKEAQLGMDDLYLVSQRYPRSSISEAYHTFRTSLLFSTPGHPPKTILVTSNNPQEGKTTVSCNLGIILAHGGARTLIIDTDLRRPSCHRVFSMPSAPGLTDHLTGHASLEEIIKPTDIKGLSILPAGPISPNPPELLDSVQFKKAIEELKGLFDFIVLDSAPVLAFADTLNLANKVDGTIIVTRSGKTTRDDLKNSVGLMRGVKASILGVVMNVVNVRKSDYYYNYYDYYGEGAGERDQTAVS